MTDPDPNIVGQLIAYGEAEVNHQPAEVNQQSANVEDE